MKERRLGAANAVIDRFDANGDGKMQESEFPQAWLTRYGFSEVDDDGNGSVTAEEYSKFLATINDATARTFQRSDRNNDGQLTKDEAPGVWQRATSYDTDSDGSISWEEFQLGEGKREHQANVRKAGQRLLGLQLAQGKKGLEISRVTPGSPAYDAKIRTGDTLVSIHGEVVGTLDDVRGLVSQGPDKQTLKLIRDGKEIERVVEFQSE